MTTKTFILRNDSILWPTGPVPIGHLESIVQDVRRLIVNDEDERTCMFDPVTGTFSFQHILTPLEEAQDRLEAADANLREIGGLLPRDGEAIPPELMRRIRYLAAGGKGPGVWSLSSGGPGVQGGGGGGPPEPL